MKTKSVNHQPEDFVPCVPGDFIGPARGVAEVLFGKAERMVQSDGSTAKLLLYGPPGVGKTRLAEMFSRVLTEHSIQVTSINGRSVTPDIVRRWQEESRFLQAFGKFTVKIINELDTCPSASQDLLLTYLDDMPGNTAFVGTSNLEIKLLMERFQTRLQQFKVENPKTPEINRVLARYKLASGLVKQIAVSCGGNVRAALMDAQSVLDAQRAQRRT
jgi:replication-associated recombination protein RarA